MSASPPAAAAPSLAPFETVIEVHGPAVLRFCIARGGADAGEDAFQETMIAALRAYPELRDPAAARGWLFSIAHRKTIDAARAAARVPHPAGDPSELELIAGTGRGRPGAAAARSSSGLEPSSSPPAPGAIGGASPSPEPVGALIDDPWAHVRGLPSKQREAVTLRYLGDLTPAEIATVMDTSPEAARRNVFEGLRRLRTTIEEQGT